MALQKASPSNGHSSHCGDRPPASVGSLLSLLSLFYSTHSTHVLGLYTACGRNTVPGGRSASSMAFRTNVQDPDDRFAVV